ncbi:hypothetical protein [Sphingomonas sp.]|jgi:hypothetical protein|uniref:hypothetical protein n=1 Tax=Sphingomonas sp. TaxID=28214 RepID=UPI002E336F3B|nr:hypothetical protein [Sphingomonas sp.]HEX4693274.1 hypothetical protein [Sphingomonas sp.]
MSRDRDSAEWTYVRRVIPTMIVYLALIVAVPFLIAWLRPSGPALWLIALLPAVPLSAVFWFYGRFFVELRDEYIRLLEIKKAVIATGIVMMAATAWGFLESYAGAPHLPLFAVPLAWFPCQGIGAAIVTIAERMADA